MRRGTHMNVSHPGTLLRRSCPGGAVVRLIKGAEPMRSDVHKVRSDWVPQGHCVIFACDIVGFGTRPDEVQEELRKVMYSALEQGFAVSGLPLDLCYREDRGDGAIVVLPPGRDPAFLVHPLPDHLRKTLRAHNRLAVELAQLRLRISLHEGQLASDENGMVGTTVNHAARMLDAPVFKEAIGKSSAALGIIASDDFYAAVVKPGRNAADPDEFKQVEIRLKETRARGWLCIREPARRSTEVASSPPRTPPTSTGPLHYEPIAAAADDTRSSMRRPPIFEIVDRLMDIPLLTTVDGRAEILASLRPEIAIRIARHPRPQHDVLSMVRTCLEFQGGLEEFLVVVRELAGDTTPVRVLDAAVAEAVKHHRAV